ncbi:transposase [Bacillus phage Mgbh1]|uniref:Transposase-like protein n=1 Tax=Bacillus phage Mgbh1 TaxID=1796993 RepID=A0A142F1Q5_9CAUD|nr:transposase [Bacillus phage Mgbh1]AMQ66712.1 transposase-like protein [Bacillus phage Mgbh1]
MKITKTMKYEIDKSIDVPWKTFLSVLRDVQYAVWKTGNIAVKMTWDFQQEAWSYRQRFGEQLKFSDLGTGNKSQSTDIYQRACSEYPNVASSVLDATIRMAQDRYKTDAPDIYDGLKTIPYFKRELPIPIRAQQTKLTRKGTKRYVSFALLSKEGAKKSELPTRYNVQIRTGKGAREIFDRLVDGEYKLCDSKILRKKGKWYLALSYSFEAENPQELDPKRVMGVDLGIVKTAYMAFNFDEYLRYEIEGGEISAFRGRIESRRKSLLKQARYCGEGRRGHGRKTRMKPLEKLRDKVANFRRTKNHHYSKYIVEMAAKHGCGTIQMEDLSGINKRDKFLANWSYYELQSFVKYKAKERGIKVVLVDPNYTSQRCSCCGYIAEGNRKTQETFKCVICGYKTNADFNAARNIAEPRIKALIDAELKRQEKERKEAM